MNPQPKQRIQSIDILRGIVMLIMALDHARDYLYVTSWTDDPLNLTTTTPQLFFTRWITHFCAPVFVFLSGTSAFLAGQKRTKQELSAVLIKRGFWLVLAELTIVVFGWRFDPFFRMFGLQVIWAIGWSMVILGLLVRTSISTILLIGFIIVFGHNVLDYVPLPQKGAASVLWNVFLTTPLRIYPVGQNHLIFDIYAILPWSGLMMLGYGFGRLYQKEYDRTRRSKILLSMGFAAVVLFIILRFINQYGDPSPWSSQKNNLFTFLSFINVTKYPVSLMYSCMTLGPAFIALALLERAQNTVTNIMKTYGRVPFFYYVCHIYFIHAICVIFFYAAGYGAGDIVDPNTAYLFRPQHFGYSLSVVYAVWSFVIVVLYWPCKWFDNYRRTHDQWWLSYL